MTSTPKVDGQIATTTLGTAIIQFRYDKINSQLSVAFHSMPKGLQAFHFDRRRMNSILGIFQFCVPNPQTPIVSNNLNSIKTESTHEQGGSTVLTKKELERCVQEPKFAIENLPQLLSALISDDETDQNYASEALENCGAPPSIALATFLEQLRSGDSTQVYWACTMLGRWFMLNAKPPSSMNLGDMQRQLCQVLHRELEISAKERAVWALGQIQQLETSTREALELQLENAPPRIQRLIETALQSSPA